MCSRKKVLAIVAGLLTFTPVAQAADLAFKSPAVPAVPYTWSGLYIGLNAGYSGATLTETQSGGATGSGSASIPGGVGGFQVGANYQISALVLGFEADFDGAAQQRSVNVAGGAALNTAQIPWIGTLRARAGVVLDRVLLYVTAGGAATQLRSNVNITGVGTASTTFTHGGWTAGGGVEGAISNDLSVRVEYLYVEASNLSIAEVGGPPPVIVNGRLQDSMVRAGLNYRLPVAW
jgi:outer membrane immunogenic protein